MTIIDIVTLISAAGGGSILTAIVNSALNKKRAQTDMHAQNLQYLSNANKAINDFNEDLQRAIDNIQTKICYLNNCASRINHTNSVQFPQEENRNNKNKPINKA